MCMYIYMYTYTSNHVAGVDLVVHLYVYKYVFIYVHVCAFAYIYTGAVVEAVDLVLDGTAKNAFCVTRPGTTLPIIIFISRTYSIYMYTYVYVSLYAVAGVYITYISAYKRTSYIYIAYIIDQ